MKDTENLHLKVQDLCTCFSGNDPLKEMSALTNGAGDETEEAALKWLALAALHGVNANAKKISLKEDDNGSIQVTAEYNKTELPSPGKAAGSKVFDMARQITHIEGDKGQTRLALGIMDSSIELSMSIKEKKGKRKFSIKFPENE
jgi:hypothetical protein